LIAKKSLLFFSSLIFTVILLEACLRLGGVVLYENNLSEITHPFLENSQLTKRNKDNYYEKYNGEKPVVLTIGDSFTNGGMVETFETYPYQVKKNLDEFNVNSTVYNWGRCEDNTGSTKERFYQFMDRVKSRELKKPDHLFVLVGSADLFGFNFEPSFKDDIVEVVEPVSLNFLNQYRVYKVFRFIKHKLNNALNSKDHFLVQQAIDNKSLRENLYDFHKVIVMSYQPQTKRYILNAGMVEDNNKQDNDDQFRVFSEAFTQDVYTIDIKLYLNVLNKIGFNTSNTSELTKIYLNFLEHSPYYIFKSSNEFFKFFTHSLIKNFRFQSMVTPNEVMRVLTSIESKYPELKRNLGFKKYKKLFSDWSKRFAEVNARRVRHWIDIIDLARKNKINVVALTYPSSFNETNELIRSVSKHQNIDLLDVNKKFKELKNKKEFLLDDDHANAQGHLIMAKLISEYIKDKN